MNLEKISLLIGVVFGMLLSSFIAILFGIFFIIFLIPLILILLYTIKRSWTHYLSKEMFFQSLEDKIDMLKIGVNDKSLQVLNYFRACVYDSLFFNFRNIFRKTELPNFQHEYFKQWLLKYDDIKKEYKSKGITKISPEVMFFRHGLIYANEKILSYIKERDILDLGAYIGDSALVLSNYTNAKVYSYELSKKNHRDI